MKRLRNKDIFDIFNLFQLELSSFRNLTKSDEMRIQKKLNSILNPTLRALNIMPEHILKIVETNLSDVLKLFKDKEKFLIKLSRMLDERILTPEERSFARIKDLDPKKIRKKLDDIGLSRSNILRPVLARILRDSVDDEGLLDSVNREAKKIAKQPDVIILLLKLKENDQLSFMEEMINLLLEKVYTNKK